MMIEIIIQLINFYNILAFPTIFSVDRLASGLGDIEFSTHYADYVKEMDESLHKRAVDYAKTFTDVEGVEFNYIDEDEEDE